MMKHSKKWLLIAMIALICLVGVGDTIAYLVDKTDAVTNTFTPTSVKNEVDEEFDNQEKKNVRIKNTGTTSAYIRVAVVGNWCDKDGNIVSAWVDNIKYNTDDWMKGADGFWYYKYAVKPDDSNDGTDNSPYTDYLFTSYDPAPSEDGTHLELQIISQAIQSEPDEAVESVWPVTANNGTITLNKEASV